MIKTTFQKANGDIIYRIRNTFPSYRVGDKTSMGWKVLDIKYNYKGKYYSRIDYDTLVDKDIKLYKRSLRFKRTLYRLYKELVFCSAIIIIIKAFNVTSNIAV